MAHVNYVYYTDSYLGSLLSESLFNSIEPKAEIYLNKCTYGNISTDTSITNTIKSCLCEICEIIYADSKRGNKTSESNDGWSVSWDVSKSLLTRINETVKLYLDNTNDRQLLYSGVKRYGC